MRKQAAVLFNLFFLFSAAAFAELRKGSQADYNHVFKGAVPYQALYIGANKIWEQTNPPVISSLTAAPSSIDLDTRSTGNITITFAVSNSTHNSLTHQDGRNIPFTTSTSAIFTQPTQTETYTLTSSNAGGAASRSVTVSVTQNAVISNFRRTGFRQSHTGAGGGYFQFTARIKGTPRPVITWRFGNGRQSQRGNDSIHWTAVSGQINTWDAVLGTGFGFYHPNLSDSLTWTATNSSNASTATIANISQ